MAYKGNDEIKGGKMIKSYEGVSFIIAHKKGLEAEIIQKAISLWDIEGSLYLFPTSEGPNHKGCRDSVAVWYPGQGMNPMDIKEILGHVQCYLEKVMLAPKFDKVRVIVERGHGDKKGSLLDVASDIANIVNRHIEGMRVRAHQLSSSSEHN